MKRIAIGDIHGCLTSLETMLDLIKPDETGLIVTLGDYVDRGPDSKGVIDSLIQFQIKNVFSVTFAEGKTP